MCSKSKEVKISLTNPQNLAVAFDGYYILNQGNQEPMTGTTPKDYEFSMKKGDQLSGIVYKSDSTNFTDTLRFQVYIDDVEQPSLLRNIVIPTQLGGIQFQFTVQ
ncbi:MAG: hypothetical protein ABIL44_08850 [candidate division WOR-3 bacterium]